MRGHEDVQVMKNNIRISGFHTGHVQGIAQDGEGNLYISFTTCLVKTDLAGNLIGSVSGLVGGELTASPRGLLLGVASGFCYATYTVFAHYALDHYESLTMTYWTFVFSGLGSLLFWDTQVMAQVLKAYRLKLKVLTLTVTYALKKAYTV